MGWTLFWLCVVGLIVWFICSAGRAGQKAHERSEQSRVEREAKREAFDAALASFKAMELPGEETHPCKLDGKPAFFATLGDTGIRVIGLSNPYVFEVIYDRTIQFADCRSIVFEQDDVIEKFNRRVVTPVAVQKKKSAVGRGLVGGVLLGPAGLVLGAASGVSPSTKIVNHTTSEAAERVVKGPPMLVITTRDRVAPFTRLEFAAADESKAWALWMADQIPA